MGVSSPGLLVGAPTPTTRRNAGVYVHFPWCLAKCPYCDFVSYARERQDIDHVAYADAVIREIEARASALEGRRVGSVFFGGGTPSLWDPRQLGRVLQHIRATFPCESEAEVTVECNPTSIDEERARALVDVGVNRVSIGVQSLDAERLAFLGRLHDVAGGLEAVRAALRARVPRVSADMIFGSPGQTVEEARREAVTLVDLGITHVSCYQLTIEPGTRFGELARRGRLPLADDGVVAEAFLAIDESLGALGYRHYEISNYARPGDEARHNLGYWRGDEYLGLGCAAYGFLRTPAANGSPAAGGTRYRNAVSPDRYMAGVAATEEQLDAAALLRERVMLGLRMDDWLDLDDAAASLGTDGWTVSRERAAQWLLQRDRIVRDGSRVRIPRKAWLWTDDTAARLF